MPTVTDGRSVGGSLLSVAVAAAVSLLTSCGAAGATSSNVAGAPQASSTGAPPASTPVVPWVDAPVDTSTQAFTIPGVLACTSSEVAVDVHVADPSYVGAGPVNVTFWVVDVTDVGRAPCFVGPSPEVSFYSGGTQLAIPRAPPLSHDIIYLTPTSALPPYYGRASGEIDVSPCLLSAVDLLKIDLGGSLGSVAVNPGLPGGTGTTCPAPGETYSIGLSGVTADGISGGSLTTTQTTINAPATAKPGDRVHFVVTLENLSFHRGAPGPSPTPNPTVTFQPCPTFHQELEGVVGAFYVSRLNCAAAKPIPDGGSEAFDMYIDVPASARSGPATLVWGVDGSPATYRSARSNVLIS